MINQKNVQTDIEQQITIRFKFYKKEEFKYLSHLDIVRILCRALNRAGFKVAYSSGYNPKPRLRFSPPTPLGIESFAEYGEVIVNDNIDGNEFKEKINKELNDKIQIVEAKSLPGKADSFMNEIAVNLYTFVLDTTDYSSSSLSPSSSSDITKILLDKFYSDILGGLIEKSDFMSSIYRYEMLPSNESSNIFFLKIYGYAKIFKEKNNNFFKFNNFYLFLKECLKEYRVSINNVKKEESFTLDDNGINAMQI
ncbi:MAG: TIGR03936 family radical SAM-associated protein [Actinomycetota bacterium]|nr:TIGR03936 family radical SAM-associated protein [Actinomycetota bacterium]